MTNCPINIGNFEKFSLYSVWLYEVKYTDMKYTQVYICEVVWSQKLKIILLKIIIQCFQHRTNPGNTENNSEEDKH